MYASYFSFVHMYLRWRHERSSCLFRASWIPFIASRTGKNILHPTNKSAYMRKQRQDALARVVFGGTEGLVCTTLQFGYKLNLTTCDKVIFNWANAALFVDENSQL